MIKNQGFRIAAGTSTRLFFGPFRAKDLLKGFYVVFNGTAPLFVAAATGYNRDLDTEAAFESQNQLFTAPSTNVVNLAPAGLIPTGEQVFFPVGMHVDDGFYLTLALESTAAGDGSASVDVMQPQIN